jgi:hypothetical protein
MQQGVVAEGYDLDRVVANIDTLVAKARRGRLLGVSSATIRSACSISPASLRSFRMVEGCLDA